MTDTPELHPAERYAALTALKAGLLDQIDQAAADVLAEQGPVRSFDTPYGPVNITRPDDAPDIDVARFTAWLVEQDRTDDLVLMPRASTLAAFKARLVIVNGEVVDKETGEVAPYGRVNPGGDPRVSYPATKEQRAAKEWARALFEERAAALTAGLRELTR